jgi:hypothetical protein
MLIDQVAIVTDDRKPKSTALARKNGHEPGRIGTAARATGGGRKSKGHPG